jgi:signal transduction histidine kinase
MAQQDIVEIAKSDLLVAWTILENLAVSLDQMGGIFGEEKNAVNGAASQRALQEALAAYLTPDLVKAINEARVRLGRYIPDTEAEALSACITYWSHTAAPQGPSEAA